MNLKYFSDPRDAENFEPFPLVFSRGSVAYEGNGALLASNQPGFIEGGKGVYGLGVYEQYTNLLTANIADCTNTSQNTTGFSARNSALISTTTEEKLIGNRSLKVEVPGRPAGDQGVVITNAFDAVQGQPYNYTAIVKVPVGDIIVTSIFGDGWGTATNSPSIIGTGRWQIVHVTGISPGTGKVNFYIRSDWNYSNPFTFYVGALQVIQKPYGLPWILGGTTRQPEQAHIPVNEVKKFLSLNEGCIEGLFTVNTAFKTTTKDSMILGFTNTDDKLHIHHTTGGVTTTKLSNSEGDSSPAGVADANLAVGRHAFGMAFNTHSSDFLLDGTSQSTVSTPKLPNIYGAMSLGSLGATNQFNTNLLCVLFSRDRSLSERMARQKFAMANGYYPIDDKVTAFLDLESGLKGYRRI